MLVFSNTPGVVSAVLTGQTLPFAIGIGGANGIPAFPGFKLVKSILTGFDVEDETGLGVMHTLRDRIYVYIHGERAGSVTITGVTFGGVCDDSGPRYTGMDAVYAYYERTRASTEGFPVRLVLGPQTTLAGFMRGFKLQVADPASGIGSFSFRFLTMPRHAGRFPFVPALPWE